MKHFCKDKDYTDEEFNELCYQHEFKGLRFAIERLSSNRLNNIHVFLESKEDCSFWMHIGSVHMFNDAEFAIHAFVNHKIENNQTMLDRIKENMKRYLK